MGLELSSLLQAKKVRGLRTIMYFTKLDPEVHCNFLEEDAWTIILEALPKSKDMYPLEIR